MSARDSRFAIERVAARTDGGVVLRQHVVSNVSNGYILERRREPPEAAQVRYHNVEHPNELELLSCRLCEPVHLRKSSLSLSFFLSRARCDCTFTEELSQFRIELEQLAVEERRQHGTRSQELLPRFLDNVHLALEGFVDAIELRPV